MSLLEIACSQCDRRGRRRLQNLITEYGADMGLPDLKNKLAKGCPRLESVSIHAMTSIAFEDACLASFDSFVYLCE